MRVVTLFRHQKLLDGGGFHYYHREDKCHEGARLHIVATANASNDWDKLRVQVQRHVIEIPAGKQGVAQLLNGYWEEVETRAKGYYQLEQDAPLVPEWVPTP